MIFRRSFLSALVSVVVGKRRRRKTAPKAAPLVLPDAQIKEVERAQLLAAIPTDRIRLAQEIRFLEIWSDLELEAELARRAVTPKK